MDFDQLIIFIYCLLVTLKLSDAEECKRIDKCSCNTTEVTVDLHKITRTLSIIKGDYTYDFQPCQGLSEQCDSTQGNEVALCQRANVGKNSFDIGDIATAEFSGDPASNTLQLKYTTNGVRKSVLSFKCDRNVDGKLVSIEENPPNTYNFDFNTRYSCVGSPGGSSSKKISTGSVLLIIFFLFFGIYFIAGILFLKFARGAQGTEMIPNFEFWSSLPGYIKDGIMFTSRGCKTESSYSQI